MLNLEREQLALDQICQHCGVPFPDFSSASLSGAFVGLSPSIHGNGMRIIPAGLTVEMLFSFLCDKGLSMRFPLGQERWRHNKGREERITEEGIICCDFSSVMMPVDLTGKPFGISTFEGFKEWAKSRDGVLPSIEQVLYLTAR